MAEKLISDNDKDTEGLWVTIENDAIEIPYESERAGHPVFRTVPVITILVPGQSLNIVRRPITEADKERFPRHWDLFLKMNSTEATEGWPLEQWPALSPSVVRSLKAQNFQTVEHVANASDGVLQRLGMSCGMNPHTFRDKARAFLAVAEDSAEAQRAIEERDRAKIEQDRLNQVIADLTRQISEQNAAIVSLNTRLGGLGAITDAPPPAPAQLAPQAPQAPQPSSVLSRVEQRAAQVAQRGPGRPRKEPAEA